MKEQRNTEIITCTCDYCGQRAPGVEYQHLGAPVLFTCKHCEPAAFADVAQRDVDDWLNGKK